MSFEEDEELAERMAELKHEIKIALEREGVEAFAYELENDIVVHGPLTDIVKVYLDHRSEIDEELGE